MNEEYKKLCDELEIGIVEEPKKVDVVVEEVKKRKQGRPRKVKVNELVEEVKQ